MTQRITKFYNKYRLFILCSTLLCILTATPVLLYAAPMKAARLHHVHKNHHPPHHQQGQLGCKSYHKVQISEGLYKIARHYHVNIHILAEANGIVDIHHVKAWDTLCIPDVMNTSLNTPPSPPPTIPPTTSKNPPTGPISTPPLPPLTAPIHQQFITISQTNGHVIVIHGDNNIVTNGCDSCQPTVTPSPTPSSTPSPTLSPTPSPTPSSITTHTPTVTPTLTSTPDPSPTHTATVTASPTETLTPTPSSTPTPSPTPTAHLGHWHGEYFNNGSLIGMPLYIRHDAAIDFDWQQGAPTDLPHDQFSVRWIQSAHFEEGVYILKAVADDGILVRLDDEIILDGWRDQPATEYTEIITLTAGFHELQVDYYERYGDALIYVDWGKIEG